LVLTPFENFNLTVDGYHISLKDRIAITGTLTGAAVSAILVANGQSPDISAQYFTNAIDTRTRGIDVVATYRLGLGDFGTMRLNAGYNYNQTDITDVADNPPELAALGASFVRFDRLTRGNLTFLVPKTKVYFGNSWTWSDFTLNGRLVRYGSYEIRQNLVGGLPVNDRSFGAKWITDLEGSWQATKNLNIAVGANNLFNVYPDANGIFNASLGSQQYGGSAPSSFGFTGGSYYARGTISF
jgi:iron complex outermembrane receptor protein